MLYLLGIFLVPSFFRQRPFLYRYHLRPMPVPFRPGNTLKRIGVSIILPSSIPSSAIHPSWDEIALVCFVLLAFFRTWLPTLL